MSTIKKSILFISTIFFYLMLMSVGWMTDFAKAKEEAKASNKHILLTFSGSDWCMPCIEANQEIFDKASFIQFADTNLVLVIADFPKLKENGLGKDLTKQNKALEDKYNKDGIFPMTLLLDANGKVLKEWHSYHDMTPELLVAQIKAFEHTN